MHVAYIGEWVVILGFVGSFVALYVSALFLLIRPFISHKERVPKLGFAGKLVLTGAVAGLLLGAYARFVEPYLLETTHVRLVIDGLPNETRPIRIAHFSDLHCDASPRLETRLAETVRREHPDLIFFTGDSINSVEGFETFHKFIQSIEAIAPIISIKGDWDCDPELEFDPIARAGLLQPGQKETTVLTLNGAKVCIVGIDSGLCASASVEKAPKGMPLILLTHSPDSDVVMEGKTGGIDLICCGHTHGGQIALPLYGALISQARTQRKFVSGLHKIKNTWIYTNRGIGMEGHFPRVRFCAPPELTIYELVPSGRLHQDHALTPSAESSTIRHPV